MKNILIIFFYTLSTKTGGQAEIGCQVTSTSIDSESEKEHFISNDWWATVFVQTAHDIERHTVLPSLALKKRNPQGNDSFGDRC